MTKTGNPLRSSSAFALALLAASCGDVSTNNLSRATLVEPGGTLTASLGSSDLAAPDHVGWKRLPEYRIKLEMAPAVHPSIALRQSGEEMPLPADIQIARSDQSLFVRMRWDDTTADTVQAFERFADGAAVQFALNGGAETNHMMGDPEAPVNIWYWNAGSDGAQNLAAGGFGSTTLFESKSLTANALHEADDGGHWTVVFSRPLEAEGEYQANLASLDGVQMAFAVWQGANGERDGLKRTSTGWVTLSTGAVN